MINVFFSIRNMLKRGIDKVKTLEFDDERKIITFFGDELNISLITTTLKFSLSFNLELISKQDADEIIDKLQQVIPFNYEILVKHPLDYNVLCSCSSNTETDEHILNSLCEFFNVDKELLNEQE